MPAIRMQQRQSKPARETRPSSAPSLPPMLGASTRPASAPSPCVNVPLRHCWTWLRAGCALHLRSSRCCCCTPSSFPAPSSLRPPCRCSRPSRSANYLEYLCSSGDGGDHVQRSSCWHRRPATRPPHTPSCSGLPAFWSENREVPFPDLADDARLLLQLHFFSDR